MSQILDIFQAREVLNRVVEIRDPDLANSIVQVELHFERYRLSIDVTGDDELKVCVVRGSESGASDYQNSVWKGALGSPLFGYWMMSNQTGYSDALQLAFGVNTIDLRPPIQLQAAASCIQIFEVKAAQVV